MSSLKPFSTPRPQCSGPAPSPPPRRSASPLMRRARPMGARGGAGRGGGLGARLARASVRPRQQRQERVPALPRAPLSSGAASGGGERDKARRAFRARRPGAWLRDAPSSRSPSMGKLHSKPGQCPRPRAGPRAPAARVPRLLTLCLSILYGSRRRRRRRARCACSRRVQAQGEPGR